MKAFDHNENFSSTMSVVEALGGIAEAGRGQRVRAPSSVRFLEK